MSPVYATPAFFLPPWSVEQVGVVATEPRAGTASMAPICDLNAPIFSAHLHISAKLTGRNDTTMLPLDALDPARSEDRAAATRVQLGHELSFITASPEELPAVPERAVAEMKVVRSLPNGWQGPGSLAASPATTGDAYELLSKMVTDLPEGVVPSIGLDSDGIIVMSWNDGVLAGSLSVHGDGTYSYYIERDGHAPQSGEANIAAPLPRKLVQIMQA